MRTALKISAGKGQPANRGAQCKSDYSYVMIGRATLQKHVTLPCTMELRAAAKNFLLRWRLVLCSACGCRYGSWAFARRHVNLLTSARSPAGEVQWHSPLPFEWAKHCQWNCACSRAAGASLDAETLSFSSVFCKRLPRIVVRPRAATQKATHHAAQSPGQPCRGERDACATRPRVAAQRSARTAALTIREAGREGCGEGRRAGGETGLVEHRVESNFGRPTPSTRC